MATHDEHQAPAPRPLPWLAAHYHPMVVHQLRHALGGLYEPARWHALERIICCMLAAGGEVTEYAFLQGCDDAAALGAAGDEPKEILSRAHAGDARAHEGAPVPPEEVAP